MARRIKVFVLIKGLGFGGAEKLLELALPYIDRNRFEYEVGYLLPWKNALVPEFEKAGIPTYCLNQRKPYDVRVLTRLAGLLRHHSVDVLHLHLPYAGIVGRIASKMAPVKVVIYTEHNLWQRYHRLTAAANRWTFGWNDAVIAVAEEVERSIQCHIGLRGKPKLSTIPNGVDLEYLAALPRGAQGVKEEFHIPLDHQLVVHVANFTPKKRHVDLLAAAQTVLKQEPLVTFLLVGQGPLEAATMALAHELGIADRVVFAGLRSDAQALIAGGDLFVLSSEYEGLPVSLLEAMAIGTPVVATRVGGIPEVITDGVEGFLVEPLKPDQLSYKLLNLLHSPELQQRFSENGRKRVQEQFDVRRMVERTEALYDRVLAEKEAS